MRVLLLPIIFTIIAGCGDHETFAEFASKYREKVCAGYVACGRFVKIEDCLNHETPYIVQPIDSFSQVEFAVANGTAKLDSSSAQACLDALNAPSCTAHTGVFGDIPACKSAIKGTVSPGGPCFSDAECEGEATCSGVDKFACVPGTCDIEPALGEGQQCRRGACAAGLFCHNDLGCQPLIEPGQTCEIVYSCEGANYCTDLDETGTTRCTAIPTSGETCNYLCLDDWEYCDPATRTCKARLASGSSCVAPSCPPHEFCLDGTCTPLIDLGESCQSNTCLGAAGCDEGVCITIYAYYGSHEVCEL